MTEASEQDKKLLERCWFFSDAVFAIVLTLLVLELHIPDLSKADTFSQRLHELKVVLPRFLAFFLSAVLVGGNWLSNMQFFKIMNKIDTAHIVYTLIYLIILTLIPFVCALIGNYPDKEISYVIFGMLSIALVVTGILWMGHGVKKGLYHPDTDFKELQKLRKLLPVFILFIVLMSASSFWSTRLSFALYLVWNLVPFVATKSLRVHHKEVFQHEGSRLD